MKKNIIAVIFSAQIQDASICLHVALQYIFCAVANPLKSLMALALIPVPPLLSLTVDVFCIGSIIGRVVAVFDPSPPKKAKSGRFSADSSIDNLDSLRNRSSSWS